MEFKNVIDVASFLRANHVTGFCIDVIPPVCSVRSYYFSASDLKLFLQLSKSDNLLVRIDCVDGVCRALFRIME